jgi:glycosyltransferase involved in cell wall biosynthesis
VVVTESLDISLVIPAYNEEGNVDRLIEESLAALAAHPGDHEIILIDDGSTDRTRSLIEQYQASTPMLRPIFHERGKNIGCHPSELEGLGAVRGDIAVFLPADLQIRPSALEPMLAAAGNADIVSGRRVLRADGKARAFISDVNNRVERWMLGVQVHDAHSAMLFRRNVIDAIVPLVQSRSALIPAEILVRARTAGFRVSEVPVEHFPRVAGQQTGVAPSELIGVQLDLVRLRLMLRREARVARPAHEGSGG